MEPSTLHQSPSNPTTTIELPSINDLLQPYTTSHGPTDLISYFFPPGSLLANSHGLEIRLDGENFVEFLRYDCSADFLARLDRAGQLSDRLDGVDAKMQTFDEKDRVLHHRMDLLEQLGRDILQRLRSVLDDILKICNEEEEEERSAETDVRCEIREKITRAL
ncbi:hypothetical protein L228DRAFT_251117, partial [Xylona heveae TC161]